VTLEYRSSRRNRVYQRKFDHDQARGMYATGAISQRELAEHFGVSVSAVARVVSEEAREYRARYYREVRTLTECVDCGGPAYRDPSTPGEARCRRCSNLLKRSRFRYDDLGQLAAVRCNLRNCANGERWQPPENFPRGMHYKDVRPGGIHTSCRACNTRSRRERRARGRP